MTYELAKKLKDAGFPQSGYPYCKHDIQPNDGMHVIRSDWDVETEGGGERGWPFTFCKSDYVTKPSLKELIEACGVKFDKLCRVFNGDRTPYEFPWGAFDKEGNGSAGETPEEAVANLWIELNGQK